MMNFRKSVRKPGKRTSCFMACHGNSVNSTKAIETKKVLLNPLRVQLMPKEVALQASFQRVFEVYIVNPIITGNGSVRGTTVKMAQF